jgi:hypothetical protein
VALPLELLWKDLGSALLEQLVLSECQVLSVEL